MQWLNEHSRKFLERGYLEEGVSPEERIDQIVETFKSYTNEYLSKAFRGYLEAGYYSLASQIWANYGLKRGLPISCFGSFVDDSMEGILSTHAEVGMMSKYGGGTSGYFGELRPRGSSIKNNGVSSGAVHFMELFDKLTDVVSQGNVRRGKFTPYLPIEHEDIMEFLDIGTEGHPIQNMTTGVTVANKWLEEMKAGDEDKRKVWAKLLQRRSEIGFPYIVFIDNANEGRPDVYKELGMEIKASNLCCEIMLPSSKNESFVCCLSSMNVLHYDEWKHETAIEVLTVFLDTVLQEFIEKIEDLPHSYMDKALRFAKKNRAIGIGTLGWHSYLQSKGISFESEEASKLNKEIFSMIRKDSYWASEKYAEDRGSVMGTNRRNTTLMAVAPTTSSAFILGQVSQSVEPLMSNYYVKDLAKDKITIKNKYLEEHLESIGQNTREVWDSIRENNGSVQHLDFLEKNVKEVFKTYAEISQYAIIDQASDRQEFIDQGQSLNILVNPNTSVKEINKLYLYAWEKKIKSLYYQHSVNAAKELSRFQCSGCEG